MKNVVALALIFVAFPSYADSDGAQDAYGRDHGPTYFCPSPPEGDTTEGQFLVIPTAADLRIRTSSDVILKASAHQDRPGFIRYDNGRSPNFRLEAAVEVGALTREPVIHFTRTNATATDFVCTLADSELTSSWNHATSCLAKIEKAMRRKSLQSLKKAGYPNAAVELDADTELTLLTGTKDVALIVHLQEYEDVTSGIWPGHSIYRVEIAPERCRIAQSKLIDSYM